ncbi:nanos homolog 1-like [Sinocyclocheilus rhinocerous]|uniref:nanos homolog 1-like n=1 Tax=Sinocyclocheilus rhinocerous TaxID=307959 RepID=UPI0007B99AA6|nr:PREDICTED: nanos homolog 1-like [Sinocyclocheilus rhinocerous]
MMQSSSLTEREKSIPAADGCFQMWRDYMDLRWTLSQLLQHRDGAQAADVRETPAEAFVGAGSSSNVSSSNVSSISASSSRGLRTPRDFCGFCHKNGEMPVVCMSHRLKARDGRILCPILRSYVCPYIVTCSVMLHMFMMFL